MPRFRRLHSPGATVHVVWRFAGRSFLLSDDSLRDLVLGCFAPVLPRCDWTLHGYALMSNHLHLALSAGDDPPCRLLAPLGTSIARRLNAALGRLGPLLAERATTVLMPPARLGALLAYLHNNPVRAGVASAASDSAWTSHRAFVGLAPPPPWLDVAATLSRAGFDATAEGRRAFDEFVAAHASEPRDARWSCSDHGRARRAVRELLALPVELSSPRVDEEHVHSAVLHAGPAVAARWPGDLERLHEAVCARTGLRLEELRSRSCRRVVVRARRIVLVAGARLLRRRANEVAASLGVTASAASRLLRDADAVWEEARRIAAQVAGTAPG